MGLVMDVEFESGDGVLGDDGAGEEEFAVGFGEAEDFDFGEPVEGECGDGVIGWLAIVVDMECEEYGAGGVIEDEIER